MRKNTAAAGVLAATLALAGCASAPEAEDPHLWLEDVTGERALAWVRERNAATEAVLTAHPDFAPTKARLRAALDDRDRVPAITRVGAHVYNFWTDAAQPRGVWRRTTFADYAAPAPAWETVLDVDALGRAEGTNWVFKGVQCAPGATEAQQDRCLVALSRGGADAVTWREFDLQRKAFVEDGFRLPEAKSFVTWIDRDTVYVGTDFGPGSLTTSGYPRIVKRWRRGTALSDAQTVLEGATADVSVSAFVDPTPGAERHVFTRATTFFTRQTFLLRQDRLVRIDHPADAGVYIDGDWLLLLLRSDYAAGGQTHPTGSLLAIDTDAFLRGERAFHTLFTPTPTRSLARWGLQFTKSRILLALQDNVASQFEERWFADGRWQQRRIATPPNASAYVTALHSPSLRDDALAEAYLLGHQDFLTPSSLASGRTGTDARQPLKRAAAAFDATGMRVEQRFATSRDGTRVPYFVVWPQGARPGAPLPTLLYGYGGFQVSQLPVYAASRGAWVERGGVFVLANIRGGGEFGPAWHQAAIKANKQRSYDDFIAVAEDLVAGGITTPRQLGMMGGSNGGLLVGAVLTQRPDLFQAVVCQVPLLDMKRFHKLLAGASWIAEYGDPDQPQDWDVISRYSPYQRVSAAAKYPQVLFITSTRDDRVHPGHARKMAERMRSQGHDVLYFENIEGGHGGAADAAQRAHFQALELSYLAARLGLPPQGGGTASR